MKQCVDPVAFLLPPENYMSPDYLSFNHLPLTHSDPLFICSERHSGAASSFLCLPLDSQNVLSDHSVILFPLF